VIRELKTFIAVSRHGTFSAAGDRIGLTQSAVSSQIRRLEEVLGFELFDRTARSAVLNSAGQTTLVRAEEICALFAKLTDLPGDNATAGLMRIGAIASVQSTVLARALAMLRKREPLLRVHVTPGVSMSLMDDLDAAKIDAAIIIRPPFGLLPELTWQSLIQESYVLLVPAAVRGQDWRKLVQECPFLRYDRTSFGGRLVERFLRREGMVVRESMETDDIAGLINLTAKGLGVALIPLAEAHLPLPEDVRVVSLGEQTFYREIGLLQRKPGVSSLDVRLLEDCLKQSAKLHDKKWGAKRNSEGS